MKISGVVPRSAMSCGAAGKAGKGAAAIRGACGGGGKAKGAARYDADGCEKLVAKNWYCGDNGPGGDGSGVEEPPELLSARLSVCCNWADRTSSSCCS